MGSATEGILTSLFIIGILLVYFVILSLSNFDIMATNEEWKGSTSKVFRPLTFRPWRNPPPPPPALPHTPPVPVW